MPHGFQQIGNYDFEILYYGDTALLIAIGDFCQWLVRNASRYGLDPRASMDVEVRGGDDYPATEEGHLPYSTFYETDKWGNEVLSDEPVLSIEVRQQPDRKTVNFWASPEPLGDAFTRGPRWRPRGLFSQMLMPIYTSRNRELIFFDKDPTEEMTHNPMPEYAGFTAPSSWWVAVHDLFTTAVPAPGRVLVLNAIEYGYTHIYLIAPEPLDEDEFIYLMGGTTSRYPYDYAPIPAGGNYYWVVWDEGGLLKTGGPFDHWYEANEEADEINGAWVAPGDRDAPDTRFSVDEDPDDSLELPDPLFKSRDGKFVAFNRDPREFCERI